jgi:DNA-binding transcriptional LysR family regulator
MKRIESLVGGSIFTKTANGTVSTQLGKIVLHHARKILDANDQMLRIVGVAEDRDVVRLGLSTVLVRDFIRTQDATSLSKIHLHTDHSSTIAKGLVDGFIDIACIFESPAIGSEIDAYLVDQFHDRLVWVRARDFVLSPGRPIPVLTWPGDEWMVRALTAHGSSFRIVMNSADYHAKAAAVEAGIGLTAVPSRQIPPNLVLAKEYYLPPLPEFRALLYARNDSRSATAMKLRADLKKLFFTDADDEDRASHPARA